MTREEYSIGTILFNATCNHYEIQMKDYRMTCETAGYAILEAIKMGMINPQVIKYNNND